MKAIRDYLILVGVPVIGVLLLLRLGQDIHAPASVGGTWVWQESAVPAENADCGRDLAWDAAPLMIITQSGPNLHITLGDVERTQMSGDIRELTITAAELATEDDAPGLQLEATVDRQVEPDVMSGRLVIEGCPEVVPFTAERQPTASPSGGNH